MRSYFNASFSTSIISYPRSLICLNFQPKLCTEITKGAKVVAKCTGNTEG